MYANEELMSLKGWFCPDSPTSITTLLFKCHIYSVIIHFWVLLLWFISIFVAKGLFFIQLIGQIRVLTLSNPKKICQQYCEFTYTCNIHLGSVIMLITAELKMPIEPELTDDTEFTVQKCKIHKHNKQARVLFFTLHALTHSTCHPRLTWLRSASDPYLLSLKLIGEHYTKLLYLGQKLLHICLLELNYLFLGRTR